HRCLGQCGSHVRSCGSRQPFVLLLLRQLVGFVDTLLAKMPCDQLRSSAHSSPRTAVARLHPVVGRSSPMCLSRHRLANVISSWSSGSAFRIARSGATGVTASGVPFASALSNASVLGVAPVT